MILNLGGVMSDTPTRREIEAHLNVELSSSAGSEMCLDLKQVPGECGKLILRRLSMPLKGERGWIHLQRTAQDEADTGRYRPLIEVNGKSVVATSAERNLAHQDNLEARLLKGHGVEDVLPLDDRAYYYMWLGHNLLSKCTNWRLMEQLTLHEDIMGTKETKLRVHREQFVPEDPDDSTDTLSLVQQSTELLDKNTSVITTNQIDLVKGRDSVQRFIRRSQTVETIESDLNNITDDRPRGADAQDISRFTHILQNVLTKNT